MAADSHIPYTILSQDLTEELAPNGTFIDAWRIAYQGPSGVTAYIRIAASQYSPQAVDSLIQAELAKIEATHALGAAPPEALE